MKIQCDVCGVEAASVLCCADEAPLCRGCDGGVHSANKLASKHRRVSLFHPSSKTLPLCDICKERRGYVFCQEDRAILCKDCDLPIHSANIHTGKHNRFLLSGISISNAPIHSCSPSTSPPPSQTEIVSNSVSGNSRETAEGAVCISRSAEINDNSCSGSTISDYLMKMLPGWRVHDFLSNNANNATAGNRTGYNLMSEPVVEAEAVSSSSTAWAWPPDAVGKMEDVPIWVPPFPAQVTARVQERFHPLPDSMERCRSGWNEEVFIVPQSQYQNTSNKRSKTSLWC